MSKLIDSDSSGEELLINSKYANKYEEWRRKEEIMRLKAKYGEFNVDVFEGSNEDPDDNTDSDESDEESDEDINNVFNTDFLKVYSALKRKDPLIYDKNVTFFNESKEDHVNKEKCETKISSKSLSLFDYHKNLVENRDGVTEEDLISKLDENPNLMSYNEEMDLIRNEFKQIVNSDNNEDDVMKVKHSQALGFNSESNALNKNDEEMKFLQKYWDNSNMNLDEGEKYLRDYILHKHYLEPLKKHSGKEVPKSFFKVEDKVEDDTVPTNNEFLVNTFHFEEPDSTNIKRYSRTVSSLRDINKKESRSLRRSERKERKRKEKEDELKRLRELKQQELKDKLQKLQMISGVEKNMMEDVDWNVLLDDEKEFDPEKYEEKMNSLFDDYYYECENEKQKPKFEHVKGIDENNDVEKFLFYENDEQINGNCGGHSEVCFK